MYLSVMVFKKTIRALAIPVFGVLSIGLCVCTVISVIGGLLYTLGSEVRMELWPNLTVPSYLGLPIGVVFGSLLFMLSVVSWKIVKYLMNSWNH